MKDELSPIQFLQVRIGSFHSDRRPLLFLIDFGA